MEQMNNSCIMSSLSSI